MLKTFQIHLISTVVSLCAGFCCPEENDTETVYVSIEQDGLVSVRDNISQYALGDTIWVEVNIPNNLIDAEGENVDLNKLTNNGLAYIYLNYFIKTNYSEPSVLRFSDSDLIVETGNYYLDGSNFNIIAPFEENSFRAIIGLKLREEGEYFLARSPSENKIFIYIDSTIASDGKYYSISLETNFKESVNQNGRFDFIVVP